MFLTTRSSRFKLETGKLELRLPKPQDWLSWQEARISSYQQLQSVEPTWYPELHDKRSFYRMVKSAKTQFHRRHAIKLLILNSATQDVYGAVALNRLEWGAKRAGLLSYWLTQKHQNQGHMTKAIQALLDHAFTDLRVHRVEAEVLPDNKASKALLYKLGFQNEGLAKGLIAIQGQWRDHERFALVFPNQRANVQQI